MAEITSLTWVFALSVIFAFFCAFGIGANDLANSFGSTVGSKALKIWQVVIIAAFCEFLGAFFLGASVTDTLKSGIANVNSFKNEPEVFMFGMFVVMVTGAIWDNLACLLEFPVSSTHTTVGAIVGFALVSGGGSKVIWSAHKATFPYFSGLTAVLASWVVSPVVSGVAVSILYFLLRTFVLRRKNSFKIAFWCLPLFVGATFGLISGFIAQTGGNNGTWPKQSDGTVAWISTVIAVGTALLTLVLVMPYIRRKAIEDEQALRENVQRHVDKAKGLDTPPKKVSSEGHVGAPSGDEENPNFEAHEKNANSTHHHEHTRPEDVLRTPSHSTVGKQLGSSVQQGLPELANVDPEILAAAMADVNLNTGEPSMFDKAGDFWTKHIYNSCIGRILFQNIVVRQITKGIFADVHASVTTDKHVAEVWSNAEVFDYKTERLFRYLQVFSAMAMSFAHGSNDVANSIGPFSAVYTTWNTGAVPPKKTQVQEWQLALGGAGIVVGLATLGHHIMRVLGVKAVKLTNVRGFVCELCTAFTVVIASRFGLPVSTTQVITGAILAIGLWEGRKGVNWRVTLRIFFGWVLTLLVACGISALLCALAFFSPNQPQTNSIYSSTTIINTETLLQLNTVRAANPAGSAANSAANQLNATLVPLTAPVRDAEASAKLNAQAFALYQSSVCNNTQG